MSEILTTTQNKIEPPPLANFARKPQIDIPENVLQNISIQIPPIFYWEDVVGEQSISMTMAFTWHGMVYGMQFPIADEIAKNFVRMKAQRQRLFNLVKESLDVLVHHGKKVLDASGNINPRLVNEEEAIRYRYDPLWDKKVAAFNKLVRAVPITRKRAIKLGLLDVPKIIS